MNQTGAALGPDVEPCPKDIARVLAKVTRNDLTGCWHWEGAKDDKGYGRVKVQGKPLWVHRYTYAAFRRPLIATLTVQHKCRNPSCCNPWHLELLTHSENTADGNSNRQREDIGDEIPF